MGQVIKLLLDRGGMAKCRSSSHLHLVREEASSSDVRLDGVTGSHNPGDYVQTVSAETGGAMRAGSWVGVSRCARAVRY